MTQIEPRICAVGAILGEAISLLALTSYEDASIAIGRISELVGQNDSPHLRNMAAESLRLYGESLTRVDRHEKAIEILVASLGICSPGRPAMVTPNSRQDTYRKRRSS